MPSLLFLHVLRETYSNKIENFAEFLKNILLERAVYSVQKDMLQKNLPAEVTSYGCILF